MRKTLICLFILTCFYTVHAQKSSPAPVITKYMQFTGTIDKYPVTFHLFRIKNNFTGCYYYNSTEQAIEISGSIDNNRFLKLTHTSEKGNEVLEGVFKDTLFSGTWSFKGKMLPFRITQKNNNNGLAFDYIWASGSKKISDKDDIRSTLSYEATAVWPATASTHPATGLIKQTIREAFDEKNSQEEIGKIFIKQKNELLNAEKSKDGIETYELETTLQIVYCNAQLLTLATLTYADGGGAHPNHFTNYSCIDLVHNRKLDITDVLDTLAGRTALNTLLEKKFRVAFNVKKEEKLSDYLFEDIISPNNNFLLTAKGIGFHYNPYAIAAYALGDVYLYIPFKEIDAYLKPEFKQLLVQ